jgi:hypothetical protein
VNTTCSREPAAARFQKSRVRKTQSEMDARCDNRTAAFPAWSMIQFTIAAGTMPQGAGIRRTGGLSITSTRPHTSPTAPHCNGWEAAPANDRRGIIRNELRRHPHQGAQTGRPFVQDNLTRAWTCISSGSRARLKLQGRTVRAPALAWRTRRREKNTKGTTSPAPRGSNLAPVNEPFGSRSWCPEPKTRL